MACVCSQNDIYTIKSTDQECFCAPSENKLEKIFSKMLGISSSQSINIQKKFEQEYLIPKKLILDITLPNVDLYLMVGSNRGIDINARDIKTFDLVDRSDGDLDVFTDLNLDIVGSVFVSIIDILHHIEYPEGLVDTLIDKLNSGRSPTHYILIADHDCHSWEDVYYLDEIHYSVSQNLNQRGASYLPTYGYRKRQYWRTYMVTKGYKIVAEKVPDIEYVDYVDIYMKT